MTFSRILPQVQAKRGVVNDGINLINLAVSNHLCDWFAAYRFTGEYFDEWLLCGDGIHLSVNGVRVMEKALENYLGYRDIYLN